MAYVWCWNQRPEKKKKDLEKRQAEKSEVLHSGLISISNKTTRLMAKFCTFHLRASKMPKWLAFVSSPTRGSVRMRVWQFSDKFITAREFFSSSDIKVTCSEAQFSSWTPTACIDNSLQDRHFVSQKNMTLFWTVRNWNSKPDLPSFSHQIWKICFVQLIKRALLFRSYPALFKTDKSDGPALQGCTLSVLWKSCLSFNT